MTTFKQLFLLAKGLQAKAEGVDTKLRLKNNTNHDQNQGELVSRTNKIMDKLNQEQI